MSAPSAEAAVAAAIGAVQRGEALAGFDLAAQALADGYLHPVVFKLRAALREREGRLPEAADDFREALRIEPDDFSASNGLGLCLARLGDGEGGVAALEKAVALEPDFASARLNLGWALEGRGEMARAEAAYAAALALQPTLARARAALAMLATRRGDWAEARTYGAQALADDPGQTPAVLALAIAAVHEDHADAEARLQGLLAGPLARSSNERSLALAALGDLHDRQGRYSAAFAAYLAAKAVVREGYASRFDVPGRLGVSDILARILQHRGGQPPAPRAAMAGDRPDPVFLLSFPRSGTTLVGQVLNGHPELVTLEEGERLADAANAFLVPPDGLERLDGTGEAELEIFRARYWDRVRASGVALDGRRLVDKMPTNTLGLPLIARLFPDSLVIYMARDPRDVLVSCLRQSFAVNPATWELLAPDTAASFLDLSLAVGRLMRGRFGDRMRVQGYEALVADFEGEVAALCAFLGLDPAPIARFPDAPDVSAIATPSARQIAAGLNAASIGQWRHYADDLAAVLPRLAPWAREMGYSD